MITTDQKTLQDTIRKNQKEMVSVCAWCPKETYPKLSEDQEYTHGICPMHYRKMKIRKHKYGWSILGLYIIQAVLSAEEKLRQLKYIHQEDKHAIGAFLQFTQRLFGLQQVEDTA